jgi:hypothetical protein
MAHRSYSNTQNPISSTVPIHPTADTRTHHSAPLIETSGAALLRHRRELAGIAILAATGLPARRRRSPPVSSPFLLALCLPLSYHFLSLLKPTSGGRGLRAAGFWRGDGGGGGRIPVVAASGSRRGRRWRRRWDPGVGDDGGCGGLSAPVTAAGSHAGDNGDG